MKALKNKLTGRLGETQFGNDIEVLIRNAKSAGFKEDEIEIIDMTPQEYREAIRIQNEQDLLPITQAKKQKEEKIRKILNLTEEEWQEFKEVIR